MTNDDDKKLQPGSDTNHYLSCNGQHTSLNKWPHILPTEGSSSISLAHKSGL